VSTLKARLLQHRRGDVLTPRVDEFLRRGTPQFSEATMHEVVGLAVRPPRSRSRSFSASGLDRCLRQQFLQLLDFPQEEVPNARLANIFCDGNWRHLRWQALFIEMGLVGRGSWVPGEGIVFDEGGDLLLEVGVEIPEKMVRGTMDAVLVIDGDPWIVDVKGANPRVFSGVKQDTEPYRAYQMQLLAYMDASKVDNAMLFYEDKASQDYLEVRMNRHQDATAIAALDARLAALAHYWNKEVLPDPLPQAPVNPDCRSCSFQIDCVAAKWTKEYIEGELPL
jgi:hypothetical protein